MEYVYSAMVLHAAKKPVNEESITNVLKAAGVQVDAARVKALTAALEGVNIDEAIATAVAAPVAAARCRTSRQEGREERGRRKRRESRRRRPRPVSARSSAEHFPLLFQTSSPNPNGFCLS